MITAVTVVALACKPRGKGSERFTPSFFVPPGCPSTTQVAARSSDPEWSRFPGTVPVYDCCHSSVLAHSSRVLSQLRTLCIPESKDPPGAQHSAAQSRFPRNVPQTSWNLPESPGVLPQHHRPSNPPNALPSSCVEQMADTIPFGIQSAPLENSASVILGKERKREKKKKRS